MVKKQTKQAFIPLNLLKDPYICEYKKSESWNMPIPTLNPNPPKAGSTI